MPIDALSVLCAQLTRDVFAIAKFPLEHDVHRTVRPVCCETDDAVDRVSNSTVE